MNHFQPIPNMSFNSQQSKRGSSCYSSRSGSQSDEGDNCLSSLSPQSKKKLLSQCEIALANEQSEGSSESLESGSKKSPVILEKGEQK